MKTTPYTAQARKKAKHLLSLFYAKEIQIWEDSEGFTVMTFENPSFVYGSVSFPSKESAFIHIICRAANTGFDLERFREIAKRYFLRYLAERGEA